MTSPWSDPPPDRPQPTTPWGPRGGLTETQLRAVGFLQALAADRRLPAAVVLDALGCRAQEQGTTYAATWGMSPAEWAPVVQAVQQWDATRHRLPPAAAGADLPRHLRPPPQAGAGGVTSWTPAADAAG